MISAWMGFLTAALFGAVPPAPQFLLPDDVIPTRHSIELSINPALETFEGSAKIEVNLRKRVSVIWLNGKNLTVRDASIQNDSRTQAAQSKAVAGEFIGLEPDAPVGPGHAVVSIRYRGRLEEKILAGAFRRNINGGWFVFTTFTPIDARRAFPCFDEPRFKTPWELAIRVRHEYRAFANAPAIREVEEPNGMKVIHFAPTEPLPAEVVAFAVGRFDVLDGGRAGQSGTPLSVITPPGLAQQGVEAVRATSAILPRLERYAGTPHPYPKLDFIALPDGAFGATENAGLIAYRQRSLLVEPGKDTPDRVRALRGLIAHELAHQWFGNLVTQASWRDVWLSEGFATWLSLRVTDEEQPWTRRNLGAVAARERIMRADAGKETRPVRRLLRSRADMETVYNRFVYQKGAAVLLMIEAWLGENRFQESARQYLQLHRFGTATAADLARAVHNATGADVSAVFQSFLDRTGVPSVRVQALCSGAKPHVRITQSAPGGPWSIPVCWKTGDAERTCAISNQLSQEIEMPQRASCPAWIYPNAGGTSYYRTDWESAQLASLAEGGFGQLTAAERLTLVYDLGALRRAGTLGLSGNSLLKRLAEDPEPEISRAARETSKPAKTAP
jgi:alanyl aminopeptidase